MANVSRPIHLPAGPICNFCRAASWRWSDCSSFSPRLKWGALLFVVNQYETVIVTRFGKAIRTEKTPGLKMKLPFFDVAASFR